MHNSTEKRVKQATLSLFRDLFVGLTEGGSLSVTSLSSGDGSRLKTIAFHTLTSETFISGYASDKNAEDTVEQFAPKQRNSVYSN